MNDPVRYIELMMGHVMDCYIGCILDRASHMKETLSDFGYIMDPDKWDTMVWRRVTQHP